MASTSAEKVGIEKVKASMLSINSKKDKLIKSQADLIALASNLVNKIVPDHLNLPKHSPNSSLSDPRAAEGDFLAALAAAEGDFLAAIEAAEGISEKTEAYLLSVNSMLDKAVESQAAIRALFMALIEQFVCPDCLKHSLGIAGECPLAPLPPSDMSDSKAVGELSEGLLKTIL